MKSTLQLLQEFHESARCRFTQEKASRALDELRTRLNSQLIDMLMDGWIHTFQDNCDAKCLDSAIKKVWDKFLNAQRNSDNCV